MNKERVVKSFIDMVEIYSPSKKEGIFTKYLAKIFTELGLEIYLDNGNEIYGGDSPTLFAKLKGDIEGEGVTLAAHTDVVEPCNNVKVVIDGDIIRTDKTTTLGGDDKAGIASILEVIRVIKEKKISHRDIFIVLTPCEEVGMLGAKNINWEKVPSHMIPSKNMIVIDNAGEAGLIAHTAPSKYDLCFKFIGRKAHAGIEPEKGINAIQLASIAISNMKMGRIDELTTSNIGSIEANFPTNVVADECVVKAEVRGHLEDKILEIISGYEKECQKAVSSFGGSYSLEKECSFPSLKPTDNLVFANEFAKIYEELNVKAELRVIGGGSDSNIFAKRGYNSIIIGAGMYDVHTVDESLNTLDLFKTTEAVIRYISK